MSGGLRERLERAAAKLEERAGELAPSSGLRQRVEAKAEGVRLALWCLGEEERAGAPGAEAELEDLESRLAEQLEDFRLQTELAVLRALWTTVVEEMQELNSKRMAASSSGEVERLAGGHYALDNMAKRLKAMGQARSARLSGD